MNTPQTHGSGRSREVSIIGRLAWLGGALWLIAVKSVVVVEFTPVAFTSGPVSGLVYTIAFGAPPAVLLGWVIRSGLRFAWKPGLIATALLSVYLFGVVASGLLDHLIFASTPWETETVLYVHRTDPDRTIERQVQYTIGRRFRYVQQRAITPFLAYAEPVQFSEIREREPMQDEWKPTPESGQFLR